MQMMLLTLLIAAPFVVLGDISEDAMKVDPMGKVFEMLDELKGKVIAEGEAEAKAYKEYFDWCDDTASSIGFEIKTATSKKESLEATIAEETSTIDAASSKIEELAATIAKDEAELKDATLIREKEAAEFSANEADLVETIDTLSRAISILEKEMSKNAAAFAQIDTSNINNMVTALRAVVDAASFRAADKQKLIALVQSKQQSSDDSEDDDTGAPAAAAYKTHSGGIFDLLEDLKEEAEEQLAALRKAETTTKHNYGMLKQSLEDSIAADTKASDEEKAAKSAAEESKATAESDLALTVKALEDAKAALATCHSNCIQTAADHEMSVKARTEELTVLEQAKKILKESTSGAVSQTYSLVQMTASSQLRTTRDLVKMEVVTMVKRLAKQHHSAALAQLASRIAAVVRYSAHSKADPFGKVRSLITDLIAKLEAEAEAEATEKAWCDEQMAKTEAKKSELEEDVEKLTTKIDQATAKSAELKEEVKTLQEELAALAKEQAEMDKIRAETHADYVQAKADLEAGLGGVRKALSVLRDYYGGASAAALLQDGGNMRSVMKQPAMPEMHGKATGAGDSIISILEVCESDFASGLAKEEQEEADAESEYEKMTQENAVTKTLKDQDVKYKTQEYTALDKSVSDLSSDLATEQSELKAVLDYYGKVKDRCIAVPESYEERKAKREAEIKGLKEALNVLETETALVQTRKHRGGRRGHFLGF
jgi:hypothetical protein